MNAEIDITGVAIATPRLLLRPWRSTDLEDLYAYASVDGVGQMAGWLPHRSREESRTILDMFIREKRTFALECDGHAVGSLGIERYDEARFPEFGDVRAREIGFVLAKDCWGRGLMPEAVDAAVEWLFDGVRLDVILCGHFLRNERSARVQRKCGFRHYAFTRSRTVDGAMEDHEYNLLTRGEWLARQEKDEQRG